MHTYIYMYVYIYIYICTLYPHYYVGNTRYHIYTCTYIDTRICIFVYIHIFIYI